MKSDADHSNWRIRSCVGTDRDDKGRQLQQTSLTLGKAMIALRIKGRQSLCRQSALPRPIQGGDHQRGWRLLAITFTVIIRQTGNTPGANNSKLQKEGDNRHSGQHQRLTFSKGKGGRMGDLPTPAHHCLLLLTSLRSGVSAATASFSLRRAGSEGGPNARQHNKEGKSSRTREQG